MNARYVSQERFGTTSRLVLAGFILVAGGPLAVYAGEGSKRKQEEGIRQSQRLASQSDEGSTDPAVLRRQRISAFRKARDDSGVRGRVSSRSRRTSGEQTTGTTSAAGVVGSLCSQPDNCQARNNSNAIPSNRITSVIADDFRPSTSGLVTELCWWGTYAREVAENVLVDCHDGTVIDTFEVRYCDDAGGVPGPNCTTFSQKAGTLTVTGPVDTGALINNFLPEFAFHATHGPFVALQGNCYWVEITNDSGECSWFWEVSNEGDDWAMQDFAVPPLELDGYELADFIVEDFALCVNVPLTADSPCGPPPNGSCPNPAQDCCEEAPIDVAGCENTRCCELVCACDPDCCNPVVGWDQFCAGNGLNDNGCGAAVLCGRTCTCGDPESGDCCEDTDSPSCDDTACCAAVCVVDDFCCSTEWDQTCADQAETICPALCAPACGNSDTGDCCAATGSPFCDNASCCDAVCAVDSSCCHVEWTQSCADQAEELCPNLCAPVCGNPSTLSCCVANPFVPGCLDATCCATVCDCDVACCDPSVGWDILCAGLGFEPNCGALALCLDICCDRRCGDINGDKASIGGPNSNTDLRDYALFASCFGRQVSDSTECLCSDLDGDGDIDLCDYAIMVEFFETLTANLPPSCPDFPPPNCEPPPP